MHRLNNIGNDCSDNVRVNALHPSDFPHTLFPSIPNQNGEAPKAQFRGRIWPKLVTAEYTPFPNSIELMKFFKGMQRDDDLVVAADFHDPLAAHSARILLEAHGIRATVVGEESNSSVGNSLFGNTGIAPVQVIVSRENLSEAKTIIEKVPAAADTLIPEWQCICGANVDQGFSVCWSCNLQHKDYLDSE